MIKNILYIAIAIILVLFAAKFVLWILPYVVAILVIGGVILFLYNKGIIGSGDSTINIKKKNSSKNNVIDVDYKDAE